MVYIVISKKKAMIADGLVALAHPHLELSIDGCFVGRHNLLAQCLVRAFEVVKIQKHVEKRDEKQWKVLICSNLAKPGF